MLLVSQNYHPSQLLELCSDQRMRPLMAEVSNAYSSTGSSISAASDGSYSSSQQAAMRQGTPVYTPQLQQQQEEGGHAGYVQGVQEGGAQASVRLGFWTCGRRSSTPWHSSSSSSSSRAARLLLVSSLVVWSAAAALQLAAWACSDRIAGPKLG